MTPAIAKIVPAFKRNLTASSPPSTLETTAIKSPSIMPATTTRVMYVNHLRTPDSRFFAFPLVSFQINRKKKRERGKTKKRPGVAFPPPPPHKGPAVIQKVGKRFFNKLKRKK